VAEEGESQSMIRFILLVMAIFAVITLFRMLRGTRS
jgi:hypothetical protein